MTQTQINRAVARATGETIDFVRGMGFSVLDVPVAPPPPPRKVARNSVRQYRRRRCFTPWSQALALAA